MTTFVKKTALTAKKRIGPGLAAALTLALAFGAPTSQATDLELEGNLLNDGNTDWENLFDVSGSNVPTPKATLPTDYSEAVFVRDFIPGKSGPDESTFATGSKDTLNVNPGWQCNKDNNVNDKTDIVNAYATASEDASGDIVVYFAMERFSNEGDGNVGFWFLKDGSVGCEIVTGKTGSFTGNHSDGDILIVSEFSGGGKVSTIAAYKWVGGADGALNETPIAAGGECTGGGAGQDLCAIVNGSLLDGWGSSTDVPWLTETKQPGPTPSNDLAVSELFEGKINLTNLNLVGCFSRYMAVTRSSTSLTATLFDYALGDFNLCSIAVTKSCTAGEGIENPVINAAGDQVITTFDVTVTNDGASTVSEVTIEEDITLGTGESCELIAIGGEDVTPVDLGDGEPYEIAASLAKDASIVAQVRCETDDNPLDNKVTARAKPFAGATGTDLSASYDMTAEQLCPLNVSPAIDVNKACTDVRLVTVDSVLTMEVEVDVDLTNTSAEKLVDVDVDNVVGDQAGGTPIALTHVDSNGDPLPAFDGDLAPGETVYFKSVYVPTATKNDEDDPALASFPDRVDASGTGAISGQPATDWSTADCPLCPPHDSP